MKPLSDLLDRLEDIAAPKPTIGYIEPRTYPIPVGTHYHKTMVLMNNLSIISIIHFFVILLLLCTYMH